ncbi:hypothetical protein [uncultured Sphingomonas sp.]|uniref:hypothetical protein n=1 Tax=uncultured Sphingomonas sp. TaxID=158754 RepID=UPI00262C19E7|nr:hypothetical protein [uncultured Sphingomonas sp.]
MFVTVTGWRVRAHFKYCFGMPERPVDGAPDLVGPYELWGRTFYWRFDRGADEWQVVAPADTSLADYTARRASIYTLAEEQRNLPHDELVALLIQACIVTGLDQRADIMDAVEFATLLDPEFIGRVLARHRGKAAATKLWWVDENKTYHLH